jgi:hypothetical protein
MAPFEFDESICDKTEVHVDGSRAAFETFFSDEDEIEEMYSQP